MCTVPHTKNSIAILAVVFDDQNSVDSVGQNGGFVALATKFALQKAVRRDDFTQCRCKMAIMGVTLISHATSQRRGRDE